MGFFTNCCQEKGTNIDSETAADNAAGATGEGAAAEAAAAPPAPPAPQEGTAAQVDVEVAAEKPMVVPDGTLMRTFLEERDWGVPHWTLKSLWQPHICVFQIYALFAMNFVTWFGTDTYNFLFSIKVSEVLVAFQEGVMIAPFVGWMAGCPRWAFWLMFGIVTVFVFLTDVIMTNRSVGIGVAAIGTFVVASILRCRGKFSGPRFRYYFGVVGWALFLQLATFMFIKYALMKVVNAIVEASNNFVGGLFFPMIGVMYGAGALQTFICVNRKLMPVGVPVVCSMGQIFAVRCFATSMKIGGFIPKDGVEQMAVITAFCGSFMTNMLSGISERTFFAQRVKSFLARKLSGAAGSIIIKPEMDSYVRAKVTVSRAVIPYFWLALAAGLPAGGHWTTDVLTWIGPLVYLVSELTSECIVIQLHRVYVPIPGESWFGTRERLAQPFMHWPALQSDHGSAYKRALAAAKGEPDAELEKEFQADQERKALAFPPHSQWSTHPIFTDEVCGCLYAFGSNIHMVAIIFVLRYTHCRIWVAAGADHAKYGDCFGK